ISPDSGYFVVDTTAITSEKHGKLDVTLAAEDGGILITVSGRVKPGQGVEASRPVPRAAPSTAHTLPAPAPRPAVGSSRRARGAPPARGALGVPHAVHRSPLAAPINKPSNNSRADRLIATVGGERFGGAPTMSKGVQAMSDWLARVGVSPGSYRLENGSGLS